MGCLLRFCTVLMLEIILLMGLTHRDYSFHHLGLFGLQRDVLIRAL